MGIKSEASDNVGNAGTSVYYSLWIDGTAPAYGVFTPTVWVKSGTAATMGITVRLEREAEEERRTRGMIGGRRGYGGKREANLGAGHGVWDVDSDGVL